VNSWKATIGWARGWNGEAVNTYRILERKSFGKRPLPRM